MGAAARLSFHNPWALGSGGAAAAGTAPGAATTAVLLWAGGGASGWHSRALPTAALRGRRVVRVEVPLGRECEGECTVLLLLTGVAPGGITLPPGAGHTCCGQGGLGAALLALGFSSQGRMSATTVGQQASAMKAWPPNTVMASHCSWLRRVVQA